MIDWIFDMGSQFKQREQVIYLAIELLDRYFLQKDL